MPGTVLAIGVLVPLTALDFGINDLADWLGMQGPGLLLTGTLTAIVFGYLVRFVAIAIGSVESSMNKVSPVSTWRPAPGAGRAACCGVSTCRWCDAASLPVPCWYSSNP